MLIENVRYGKRVSRDLRIGDIVYRVYTHDISYVLNYLNTLLNFMIIIYFGIHQVFYFETICISKFRSRCKLF